MQRIYRDEEREKHTETKKGDKQTRRQSDTVQRHAHASWIEADMSIQRAITYPEDNVLAEAHVTRDCQVVELDNVRNVLKPVHKVLKDGDGRQIQADQQRQSWEETWREVESYRERRRQGETDKRAQETRETDTSREE